MHIPARNTNNRYKVRHLARYTVTFLKASSNALLDIKFPRDFELLSDFRRLLSLSRRGNGGKGVGQRKHQASRCDRAKKFHADCVFREAYSCEIDGRVGLCAREERGGSGRPLVICTSTLQVGFVCLPPWSPSRCVGLQFGLPALGVLSRMRMEFANDSSSHAEDGRTLFLSFFQAALGSGARELWKRY